MHPVADELTESQAVANLLALFSAQRADGVRFTVGLGTVGFFCHLWAEPINGVRMGEVIEVGERLSDVMKAAAVKWSDQMDAAR